MGLSTHVERFLDHISVERGLSGNTIEAYRRDLTRYAEFLRQHGRRNLALAGEPEIAAFIQDLSESEYEPGKPYRPSSVARTLAAVRSFHKFLVREGDAPDDPAEGISRPKVPRNLPRPLTVDEVGALVSAPGDDGKPATLRDRAILETLYGTGLRISELVGLDLSAVDLEEGFLRAFGKGSKERIVPVGHTAAAAIEAWLPARAAVLARARRDRSDPDALFLNPRGGRLTRQGCWKIVAGYGLRAGLGGRLSPHVLRHSCATHMVDRGADLRVVQELLGHASVSTTQIYTKVTQTRLRAVYDAAHPRAKQRISAALPVPSGGPSA